MDSDNLPIVIELNDLKSLISKSFNRFKLSKVHWGKFIECMSENSLTLPNSFTNVDSALDLFLDSIRKAIEDSGGKSPILHSKSYNKKTPDAIWWDTECSEIIKRRRDF